uniref:MRP-like ABC transporter n=1 Tax=Oryza meridionalis TaxID=40149 RepID=A0A0E0CV21_9ORYZ
MPHFPNLPLPEAAAAAAHAALLALALLLLLLRSARALASRCASCLKTAPRRAAAADGGLAAASSVGAWYRAALACCGYALLAQVAALSYEVAVAGSHVAVEALLLPAVQALAWAALLALAMQARAVGWGRFPVLVRVWWVVSFVLCVGIAYDDSRHLMGDDDDDEVDYAHMVANFASAPALGFLCLVGVMGSTGVELEFTDDDSSVHEPLLLGGQRRDADEEPGCLRVTPYGDAGIVSLATLSWLSPLLSVGAQRPLELADIPLMAHKDRAKSCYKAMSSHYERQRMERPGSEPSLAWAILKSFWREAAINGAFAAVNTIVSYVGPYLISYFVDYLSGKVEFPHEGYILASVFFVAKLLETLTARQWYLGVDVMGIHVKSGLTAMVYRKGLRLSNSSRQSHTSGEIVNYMAVDVQRVGDYAWYFHDIWMLPLQIILALAILYKNVGIAMVSTLVATVLSIAASVPVAKLQEHYQDKLMASKDERMRKTSECLKNMRILKLQAWEDRYRLKLEEMRNVECKWLRWALYSQAAVTFVFWSSPIFVAVITFGTCILLGGELTAGGVLSALATFRILQEPLRNFPDLISMIAQTRVSLDRLSHFLQQEELPDDATITVPHGSTDKAINIDDATFSWNPSSPTPTLSGINLSVVRGMRVAVCGVIGSGKSSLLSSILGEIPKLCGQVRISGSAAYVPQTAWIQSGNIEENILFGSPMDKQRYKRVIEACSLKKDLQLLQYGDQTIIGDRGINLSGGQKQRVQLARALYQDADIYLLDDPFSAVDAHTGSELFREYILTALASKTVIYVTHQIEFLPAADLILVSDNEKPSSTRGIKEKKKKPEERKKKRSVQEEERERGRVSLQVYLSYMGEAYKGTLIPLIILAQTMFQVLQIASNWWMAWANPQTEGDAPKTDSVVLLVVYMSLAFGSSLFVFVRSLLVATFGLATAQKLFVKMLRCVFRAPMSFFDTTPSGRILNRVSVDQSVVDLDIAFRLGGFASTTIQLLGIVAVMSKVTWQVLILIVPMAVACMWMQRYYIASSRELTRILSVQKSPVIHFLAAIEWLCLRMELLSTFVFAFCMAILVSFPPGTIEPSMAGLAVTYGLNLNARMSRWILSFCKLENRIISVERIYQYCKLPSEAPLIIENSRPSSSWPENGNIELVDLKVRYKDDLPLVLHGISCMFPGGKKIGIVGRTGSGKSTLIQALFRLIEPTGGKVIIDDIDISRIGLHDLRSRLSIIPQDPTLFEGTIRMNLDPLEECTDQEIWEALEKCQLGEVIRSKDEKLDSPVLENGDNWSVGQRQLIALGRALLKQAKILVLDEATASVDTATDNLIQKIIRSEFKDCTVCTIAHRIPTVIDSDLVLVLSDGKIAEFDTPQRLLEDKSSMFMQLVSEYSTRSSCI